MANMIDEANSFGVISSEDVELFKLYAELHAHQLRYNLLGLTEAHRCQQGNAFWATRSMTSKDSFPKQRF